MRTRLRPHTRVSSNRPDTDAIDNLPQRGDTDGQGGRSDARKGVKQRIPRRRCLANDSRRRLASEPVLGCARSGGHCAGRSQERSARAEARHEHGRQTSWCVDTPRRSFTSCSPQLPFTARVLCPLALLPIPHKKPRSRHPFAAPNEFGSGQKYPHAGRNNKIWNKTFCFIIPSSPLNPALLSNADTRFRTRTGKVSLPIEVEGFLANLHKCKGDQRFLLKHAANEPDKKDENTPDKWVARHPDLIRLTGGGWTVTPSRRLVA